MSATPDRRAPEGAQEKAGEQRPGFAALYALIYPIVVDVGREHGYAMGLHGSLARDLDVIAAPWIDDPSEPSAVVADICARLGAIVGEDLCTVPPERGPRKPHREVWNVVLQGKAFLDISFAARLAPEGAQREDAEGLLDEMVGAFYDREIAWMSDEPPDAPNERYQTLRQQILARLRSLDAEVIRLYKSVRDEKKCARCRHPASWHRLDDSTNADPTDPATPFRCLGHDCMSDRQWSKDDDRNRCNCPDFVEITSRHALVDTARLRADLPGEPEGEDGLPTVAVMWREMGKGEWRYDACVPPRYLRLDAPPIESHPLTMKARRPSSDDVREADNVERIDDAIELLREVRGRLRSHPVVGPAIGEEREP